MSVDQELDLYMQTFSEMTELLKQLDEEQFTSEHIGKSEFGQRLAQITRMQRMLIRQHKMVLDQLTRMNNIFGQRE